MGRNKYTRRRKQRFSKNHKDAADAFIESDTALKSAWERVSTIRAWKRLLDILPDDQRELLTHPEDRKPRKENE